METVMQQSSTLAWAMTGCWGFSELRPLRTVMTAGCIVEEGLRNYQ